MVSIRRKADLILLAKIFNPNSNVAHRNPLFFLPDSLVS
jgi:hypothetical protein